MSGTEAVPDLAPLAARYDGFLLDQFGVLHDGRKLFPGVAAALARLKAAGKPVVILSNSGKRAAVNEARLADLGLARETYAALVSSGEVAWQGLRERREEPFTNLGRACLFFSRGGDRSAVEGLDLQLLEEPTGADFVFLSGLDPDAGAAADCRSRLSEARRLGLPLLCSNPDLTAIEGDGLAPAPGRFAQAYAEAGGTVHWIGKPAPLIYRAALRRLGLPPPRVLAVGDSLDHDIAGAAGVGLDSALVTAGIHRADFAEAVEPETQLRRLGELTAARPGAALPTWLLPGFTFEGGLA